jgi:AcrR family transcriptional regulator
MKDTDGEPATTDAIMQATYRALCEHGYPETSISKIADEFEKSKSLLYYHYEDKEELLEDFLGYLLEQIETDLDSIEAGTPEEELLAVIERLLPADIDDERMRFMRALLEIRSQAPYHEAYHEQFTRTDDLILSTLVDVIERGIETEDFRAVNSEEMADFLYSTAWGATERGVTLEDTAVIHRNRQAIESYVESQLLRYA